jgi:hypothetical protein
MLMPEFKTGERTVGSGVPEHEFGREPVRTLSQFLPGARLKAPRPLNTSLCASKVPDASGHPLPGVDAGCTHA